MNKGYLSVPSSDAEKQPWFEEKFYYYPTTPLISSSEQQASYQQTSRLAALSQCFMSSRQKEKSTRRSILLRSRTRGIKLLCSLIFCVISMYFINRFAGNYVEFSLPTEIAADLFESIPSSEHLKHYFNMYSTQEELNLAQWTRDNWVKFGIKDTKIELHWPILNTPTQTRLSILASDTETVLFSRSSSENHDRRTSIPFHAYSSSGNVTGPVVYVNYGRLTDFQFLLSRGISFNGTIALMRNGGSMRKGFKIKMAQEFGCIGALLFSDHEENFSSNSTSIMIEQGNVQYGVGDPFTLGHDGNKSLPEDYLDTAKNIPKIPSLPISGQDALALLKATEGFGIRADFTRVGEFCNVNYFSGPSRVLINLVNYNDYAARPIHNVVAKVLGSVEPEKVIILGNHRDACNRNAIDPSSGSAVLMELVRTMGILLERGWRPRRTIIIASWDVKRYGAVGSTEWANIHQSFLVERAVAYLNVDYAVSGRHFNAQSSPLLSRLLDQVTQEVIDPHTNQTVFDTWSSDKNDSSDFADSLVSNSRKPSGAMTDALDTDLDTATFFNHLGVSSISFGFRGDHQDVSSLDYNWMKNQGDPTFEYHQALTKIWGLLVLRLSSDIALPMYTQDYVTKIERHLKDLNMPQGCLNFPSISSALNSLSATSYHFDHLKENWMNQLKTRKHHSRRLLRHVAKINERLMQFERSFIDPQRGHVIYGSNSNTGMVDNLPGLSEAVENDDLDYTKYMEEKIGEVLLQAKRTLREKQLDEYEQ